MADFDLKQHEHDGDAESICLSDTESVSSVASSTATSITEKQSNKQRRNMPSSKSIFGPDVSIQELQCLLRDKARLPVEMRARKELLKKLLVCDDIDENMMLCLLRIIVSIAETGGDDAKEVFHFLANHHFIEVHLLVHAQSCRLRAEMGKFQGDVHQLVEVTRAFVQNVPTCHEAILLVATVVQDTIKCHAMMADDLVSQASPQKVHDVLSESLPKVESQPSSVQVSSVFPTGGEAVDPDSSPLPSLQYDNPSSVAEFLDVHFHILLEEIVRPVRASISAYHSVKRMKGIEAAQRQCHVYTGVNVVKAASKQTSESMIHQIHFDTSSFHNVSWETTKELALGSLVCLTTSHFHQIIYATVVKRDPRSLEKGLVEIRVYRWEDVARLLSGRTFDVININCHIEEVTETLHALQKLSEEPFPLASQVVFQSPLNNCPEYLKGERNMKYDVGPLLKEESKSRKSQQSWRASVQTPEEWPTSVNLSVDEDQLMAIRGALTSAMAVITGAPGTGKTYVGLKLVNILLLNKHLWSRQNQPPIDEGVGGPLLYVCSSKATLDEFLVRVLSFQPSGIVRVGGPQARNELQEYNLERHRERQPATVGDSNLQCALEESKRKLQVVHDNSILLGKAIMPESVLKPVIDAAHYESLTENTDVGGPVMLQWLIADTINKGKLDQVKSDVQINVSQFECSGKKIADDSWLDQKLPCALDPQAAQLTFKARDKITNQLRSKDRMTQEEVSRVTNPWMLTAHSRWRLYRYWVRKLEDQTAKRSKALSSDINQVVSSSPTGLELVDYKIFRSATLVAMTAAQAIKHRRAIHRSSPQIVICDEAADMLQATTTAFLPSSCHHLILIGKESDTLCQFQTAKKLAAQLNVECSLMQQCIKKDHAVYRLQTQHRMNLSTSKISRMVLCDDYHNHPSILDLPGISGLTKNVFFIQHNELSSPQAYESTFLVALFEFLLKKGVASRQISVIVPFPGQKRLYEGKIVERMLAIDDFRGENDVVLFMCNGSERKSRQGCLLTEQRLVAVLTRARRGLYVIGNFTFLAQHNELWGRILSTAQRLDLVGCQLELSCPNHPDNPTSVTNAEDLVHYMQKKGCGQMCRARLPCGHSCKEVCHDHDRDQHRVVCNQPCNEEICENGHKFSKLCSEPYKKCGERIEKELPCGHIQVLPCYQPPQKGVCRERCQRMLSCGHKCTNLCADQCSTRCTERKSKSSFPCGHTVEVQCCDGPAMCPHPCGVVLSCEHPCSGTCGKCHRGRIHVACEQPCGRTLVCGHPCKSSCAVQCPPCPKLCANRCQHSSCRSFCGEACVPCREKCLWRCPHVACPKLCGEPCERDPCNELCDKKLPCGHPCIGLCGEKCPSKCRVCHKEQVTEIFFGIEDDANARFVELEDCGHVIEVDALDQYMAMTEDSDDAVNIQLKGCPKCKTPIRRNVRYSNVIKKILADVENVKTKIRGHKAEIERNLADLRAQVGQLRRHAAYRDGFITEVDMRNLLDDLGRMVHLEKIVSRMNMCTFLRAIADIYSKSSAMSSNSSETLSKRRKNILCHLLELKEALFEGSMDRFTEQQMNDLQQEISHADLNQQVLNILSRNLPSLQQNLKSSELTNFDKCMSQDTPFTKEDEQRARRQFTKLKQLTDHLDLGITDRERVQIVHAIGLSQGHWYKCPKGHVYCIGECGGAMENASCPECGADIGGDSHRLTQGNRVATEMDGARRAAWPTDDYDYQDPFNVLHIYEEGMLQFDEENILISDEEDILLSDEEAILYLDEVHIEEQYQIEWEIELEKQRADELARQREGEEQARREAAHRRREEEQARERDHEAWRARLAAVERQRVQEQRVARAAAEWRRREEEQRVEQAAAERMRQEEEQRVAQAAAERRRQEEEQRVARAAAERRRREVEQRVEQAVAERRRQEEQQRVAQAAAERRRREVEQHVAQAAAERRRREEQQRVEQAAAERRRQEEQQRVAQAAAERRRREVEQRVVQSVAERRREEQQRVAQAVAEWRRREEEQRVAQAAAERRRREREHRVAQAVAEWRRRQEEQRLAQQPAEWRRREEDEIRELQAALRRDEKKCVVS